MRFFASILLFIALMFSLGYMFNLLRIRYEPKEKYIYEQVQNINNNSSEINPNIKPLANHENVMVVYIPAIARRLRVDPINLDLTSDANKWPITTKGVNLIASTGEPGSGGNSVIYGHNWQSIFGNLNKLKIGDEIVIYRSKENQKLFRVTKISVVDPTETRLLANNQQNQLTLYTCTGLLDSKRLVVTTSFVEDLGDSI